jgi:hypothetical protein
MRQTSNRLLTTVLVAAVGLCTIPPASPVPVSESRQRLQQRSVAEAGFTADFTAWGNKTLASLKRLQRLDYQLNHANKKDADFDILHKQAIVHRIYDRIHDRRYRRQARRSNGYRSSLRRRGGQRGLLSDDAGPSQGPTNTFSVEQVVDTSSQLLVRVRYSTAHDVVPIFMLPHYGVQSHASLWDTFYNEGNPCMVNNGITTLCCISSLVERYHISSEYKSISRWMCPAGVAHTAASIAIPPLQELAAAAAVAAESSTSTVHASLTGLFPQHRSRDAGAEVRMGAYNGVGGQHAVELLMSRKFIKEHSLLRHGNYSSMETDWATVAPELEIYRFFVGVTFSQLQHTATISSSSALSVIALIRNSSSNDLVASVVTRNAPSAIEDVVLTLHATPATTPNRVFFARVEVQSSTVSGLRESTIDKDSVRYTLGLAGLGVAAEPPEPDTESIGELDEGSWYRPCDFVDEMAELVGVVDGTINELMVDGVPLCSVQEEHIAPPPRVGDFNEAERLSLSVLLPLGFNLPVYPGSPYVLYVKYDTQNSQVTSQLSLDSAVVYNTGSNYTGPRVIPQNVFDSISAHRGVSVPGATTERCTVDLQAMSESAEEGEHGLVAVMGSSRVVPGGWSNATNGSKSASSRLLDEMFVVEFPASAVIHDFFVVHYYEDTREDTREDGVGSQSAFLATRRQLEAVVQANNLKQVVMRGDAFTLLSAAVEPGVPQPNFDPDTFEDLCADAGPCLMRNVIRNNTAVVEVDDPARQLVSMYPNSEASPVETVSETVSWLCEGSEGEADGTGCWADTAAFLESVSPESRLVFVDAGLARNANGTLIQKIPEGGAGGDSGDSGGEVIDDTVDYYALSLSVMWIALVSW